MPQLSEKELEEQLAVAAKSLVLPLPPLDELLPLLDQIEALLSKVEQPHAKSMQNAFSPLMKAVAMDDLLKHSDVDVKVGVASCISEITRITAPDAPYDDEKMKDVFQLIVSSFENFSDIGSRSYEKIVNILEIVAKVRSCVVMLDLEFEQMIIEMFQHFLKAIREDHGDTIFTYMETIMTLVLEESEDIYPELLAPILATLKRNNEAAMPIAKKLAERVLQNSAVKLRPYLREAVKSLDTSLDDYSEVVSCLCGENTDTVGRSIESILHDQPNDDGFSLRKEDGKKSGRGFSESTSEKEVRRSSAREDHGKGIVTSRKSPLKSTKNKGTREETPKTSNKRKQTPGKEMASETLEYGENLVGAKVKVWWNKDLFYEGEIASFDSVKKKHKVAYTNGDEEVLNLQKERWEFIRGDMVSTGDQEVEHSSFDTSSDMKTKKKGNANSETSSKRQKVEGSPKSKPKYTAPKSGSKSKDDGKAEESESKDNYLKPGKKSEDYRIKSKDQSQKLGGKGRVDIGNASGRAKAKVAEASRYSKQDCQWSSKSKGKTPQSSKPPQSSYDTRVTKSGSSKVKGKTVESEEFDGSASDSEARSLDHTEKTVYASNKAEHRFSLWKEVGKKSGRARPTSEKDDRRFSVREDHGKDIVTSWRSPLKSTKNKGTQEETPKIKQTPGKEKEDIHLLLRAIEDSTRNKVSGEASLKEDIHSLPRVMENKNSGASETTIRDAMEILNNVPGIAPTSELWNYACNLLSQKDMREVFANQPSHESRLSWLGFNYDQFKKNK